MGGQIESTEKGEIRRSLCVSGCAAPSPDLLIDREHRVSCTESVGQAPSPVELWAFTKASGQSPLEGGGPKGRGVYAPRQTKLSLESHRNAVRCKILRTAQGRHPPKSPFKGGLKAFRCLRLCRIQLPATGFDQLSVSPAGISARRFKTAPALRGPPDTLSPRGWSFPGSGRWRRPGPRRHRLPAGRPAGGPDCPHRRSQ